MTFVDDRRVIGSVEVVEGNVDGENSVEVDEEVSD